MYNIRRRLQAVKAWFLLLITATARSVRRYELNTWGFVASAWDRVRSTTTDSAKKSADFLRDFKTLPPWTFYRGWRAEASALRCTLDAKRIREVTLRTELRKSSAPVDLQEEYIALNETLRELPASQQHFAVASFLGTIEEGLPV